MTTNYHSWTHRSKAAGGTDPIPSLAMWPVKVCRDDIPVSQAPDFDWMIPEDLDGHELIKVEAFVSTAGGGDTVVQVYHVGNAVDVLATPITIDTGDLNSKDAGTQPVVDTDENLVAHGDHYLIRIDTPSDALGLGVYFYFEAGPDAVAAITGPAGQDGASSADQVSYDNGTSGLSADNAQDAIDELADSLGSGAAADVTYDNSSSGLTGDNVQDALDQVASGLLPEALYAWMPLTSVVDSEPVLVWDADDSLIPTLTPIGG